MEVIIQPSPGDCAAAGARIIGKLLNGKSDAVLGLAFTVGDVEHALELERLLLAEHRDLAVAKDGVCFLGLGGLARAQIATIG